MINQNYGASGNKRPTTPNAPAQGSGTFVGPGGRLSTNNQYARIPGYDDYTPVRPPSSNITVPKPPPAAPPVDLSRSAYSKIPEFLANRASLGAEGYGLDRAKYVPVNRATLGAEGYGIDGAKNVQQRALEEEAAKQAERDRLRRIFASMPALRPEQQQAYRMAVRDANREFEMMRNQVQLGRRAARSEFRQGVREVNRQQSGGSQDLATALAYLGMDTSPATMGVGLQDLERQADVARAQLAQSKADTMAGLDAQAMQSRIGRNRAMSLAEQNKLNAMAANAAEKTRLKLEYFQ